MEKNRPVNLDLGTIRLPITSYVSILHRASGVVLFFAVGLLLCLLDASLASEESFNAIKETVTKPLWQVLIWGSLVALAYHMVAGIRHMIMDFGIGETLEGGQTGAKIALAVAALLILFITAWVFAW